MMFISNRSILSFNILPVLVAIIWESNTSGASNYCKNGRTRPEGSVYKCMCFKGWSGEWCDQKLANWCPQPLVENGNIRYCRGEDFSVETTCQFGCKEGFEFSQDGPPHVAATCQANQEWTYLPHCDKQDIWCQSPDIMNGKTHCSEDHKIFSTCTFTCEPGYHAVGPAKSTCTQHRRWDPMPPTCKKNTCLKCTYVEAYANQAVLPGVKVDSDQRSLTDAKCRDGVTLSTVECLGSCFTADAQWTIKDTAGDKDFVTDVVERGCSPSKSSASYSSDVTGYAKDIGKLQHSKYGSTVNGRVYFCFGDKCNTEQAASGAAAVPNSFGHMSIRLMTGAIIIAVYSMMLC
ncbi:E-selectin [Lingula anatina]|uniref:E-selectin n=1 Tax=Lingula anatina TaxID=7574 RepID=A0A1S3K8V5_LINAN|nr:E-selectin [Lingula anatina]|eukprot:XP_013418932.1 E-selectin [Lingula anatina]